jgi:hypothetical protein
VKRINKYGLILVLRRKSPVALPEYFGDFGNNLFVPIVSVFSFFDIEQLLLEKVFEIDAGISKRS